MKVCFLMSDLKPSELLNTYRKMTPGRSGKWKDLEGTDKLEEADWFVVIDQCNRNTPAERTIRIGAHPPCCGGYVNFDKVNAAIKLDIKNTFGFGEWWLLYDYDFLSNLKPMVKSKDLVCIITNQDQQDYQKRRKQYLLKFTSKYSLDIYGRIKPEGTMIKYYNFELGENTNTTYWFGKEKVLAESRYSLEFDAGECENYFSERFFDAMLLWCMPLYWGGTNVEKYLPAESFRYIDMSKSGDDISNIADYREQHIKEMGEARDLLLNKYQIWPRVYAAIKGEQ